MLSEISNCINKLKLTIKELNESLVKWILDIPCWILEIQNFFYFNVSTNLKLERATIEL